MTRLGARRAAIDWALVHSVLPEPACSLFAELSPGDQLHSLCVLHMLRQNERTVTTDLAQAALLHDIGKAGSGLTLLHRTMIVLARAVYPRWLGVLASSDPASWRYPFHVHNHHAERGARRCMQVGCSPLTIWLVRHHEGLPPGAIEPAWREALVALQCADDVC